MQVRNVTSLDLPELQPYRTLRRPLDHAKQGIFVAEGAKVVQRLLESDLSVVSILAAPEWYRQLPAVESKVPQIFIAEKKLLETIVGYRLHQGIMAVGRVPKERSWPELSPLLPRPMLLVALDGIVSAENVGVIVRNCVAFGVHAIFVGGTSSSPYLRRAVRNSMGAVFGIPILHSPDLAEFLTQLRQVDGVKTIATTPHQGTSIYELDLTTDVCFVFGNEGSGVSQKVLNACSVRAAIPMKNRTDSLNVSAAAAVFLYEASRRSSTTVL